MGSRVSKIPNVRRAAPLKTIDIEALSHEEIDFPFLDGDNRVEHRQTISSDGIEHRQSTSSDGAEHDGAEHRQSISSGGSEDSSIHVLPVEILQYISAIFLPCDAAASLAICNRSMLKTLGGQALWPLTLECHTIERTRFLKNLEKDLPDWLLCHHCAKFHPVDHDRHPSQPWYSFDETECARVNGVVSIGYHFYLRFEHAQLLMRDYRLGRPYETNLARLFSNRVDRNCRETSLVGVVTANIVAGELLLQIKYTLRLLENWDITLIRRRIPKICSHLNDLLRDSIFAQVLRCRLSHANRLPCIECKTQKLCPKCLTLFQVDIRTQEDLVTEVQVDIWRCLGSCESPFDSEWRRQADRYSPSRSRRQEIEGRKDQESMGKIFPTFGATDEELAKWCASI